MAKTKWIWLAAAAFFVVGTALIGFHAASSIVDGPTRGAIVTAFTAACAFAYVRYRNTRDPRSLFIALSAGLFALQFLVFKIFWQDLWHLLQMKLPQSHGIGSSSVNVIRDGYKGELDPSELSQLPTYGVLAGWVTIGSCLLFAIPWRDRRGRPPVSALRACMFAGLGLLAFDALIVMFPPSPTVRAVGNIPIYAGSAVTDYAPFFGPIAWAVAIAAIAVLAVAAWREVQRIGGSASHGPMLVSLSVAVFAVASFFLGEITKGAATTGIDTWGRVAFGWGRLLPLVTAIFLTVAQLSTQRAEASKARRATDRAQAVMGGRAEIASMIAHELRGPVTTVRGLASTASTHYDSLHDAERLEFFQLVDQEARRLLHIVDETSMALKVDAGTLTYDIRDEDLARIVSDAVAKAQTGDHPVEVADAAGISLPLDRLRLQETLIQLLDNAAKFTPPQTPISIGIREGEKTVTIDVVDHGPGFAADKRDRAFDRFAKFRPAGYEEVPGPGLGLFIARAHMRALGGDLNIEDAPGGGTMLRIELPREGMRGS